MLTTSLLVPNTHEQIYCLAIPFYNQCYSMWPCIWMLRRSLRPGGYTRQSLGCLLRRVWWHQIEVAAIKGSGPLVSSLLVEIYIDGRIYPWLKLSLDCPSPMLRTWGTGTGTWVIASNSSFLCQQPPCYVGRCILPSFRWPNAAVLQWYHCAARASVPNMDALRSIPGSLVLVWFLFFTLSYCYLIEDFI